MAWRGQAQFGTLVHLVFSGVPQANRITLERGGRLGSMMGGRGLANLEREIENLCCRPRGKRHQRTPCSRRIRLPRPYAGLRGHAAASRMGGVLRGILSRMQDQTVSAASHLAHDARLK